MKLFRNCLIIFTILFSFIAVGTADSATRVRGYYKKSGTYVKPHYRSNPNSTTRDNYSTYGNTNPYTGKPGNKRY